MNHSQIVSFIWGVADLIRDTFERGKYQDVPPRPLAKIEAGIQTIEKDIVAVLREVAG